jgi:hypothetical protein
MKLTLREMMFAFAFAVGITVGVLLKWAASYGVARSGLASVSTEPAGSTAANG